MPGKTENISPTLAIRSGKWKLLMDPDGSKIQLYDIEKDHREEKEISSQQKTITANLALKLKKWHTDYVK
ncbi:MAG: hypothetical protein EOO04_28505 [Chitinophagaceae bacterium]|nr:MAG: hypothetical protein EOO04_28505 [Chitinophagaceae bacterium]